MKSAYPQFYGWYKKITWKYESHRKANIQRKLNNMNQAMYFEKFKESNLLKKLRSFGNKVKFWIVKTDY